MARNFGETVGTREAKTHFSELIDYVIAGETITITRNGRPVAELRPINREDPRRVQSVVCRIRDRGSRVKLDRDGWTNDDYIEKGRRH